MSKVALAPGHAREYETIYILRPNVDREVAEGVAGRIAEAIKSRKGILTAAELWGHRRLAYPIARHFRGLYVYLKYIGRGDAVAEIERQLRLADDVIRFQTVQLATGIPLADAPAADENLKLDFNVPHEPDEPELTRERELGLDQPFAERHRGRRDDRGDFRNDGDGSSGDDDGVGFDDSDDVGDDEEI